MGKAIIRGAALIGLAAMLAGCGQINLPFFKQRPVAAAAAPARAPHPRTAEALDTTTPAERAAASAPPAAPGQVLGKVVVALGPPAEAGFWLRSALVTAPGKGVVRAAGGGTVQVDLLPGSGGAQLSFAAFRALGLPLTALPEVEVLRSP